MKKIICLIAFYCATFSLLPAQSSTYQATTANIASWNLSGFRPIEREKAVVFANAIAQIDPEVLVLVEVNPDFMAAEITAELAELGVCYRRSIIAQSAIQNIAVLYKCGVEVSNPRFIAGSNNNNSGLRKAFAADVKIGAFDFILIGVHLKAGRSGSDRTVRDAQTGIIASFIQAETAGPEKDVILVGDYNMVPVQDQSNFDHLNPGNFLNFLSDAFAGQFSHIGPNGPGNLLDGCAISRDHTQEYIPGSLRIIPLHEVLKLSLLDFRETVSDHLPMDATFRITDDDD